MDGDEIWKELGTTWNRKLEILTGTVVALFHWNKCIDERTMLGVGYHITYDKIKHIFGHFHQLIYVIYLQSMLFSCCHIFLLLFVIQFKSITIQLNVTSYNIISFCSFHLIKYYKIDYTISIHFSLFICIVILIFFHPIFLLWMGKTKSVCF